MICAAVLAGLAVTVVTSEDVKPADVDRRRALWAAQPSKHRLLAHLEPGQPHGTRLPVGQLILEMPALPLHDRA